MSFTGTQQKCKVCDKTVYLMDQLSADGVAYHKSCFKCNHCKSRLQANLSGILGHSCTIFLQWRVFYTASLISSSCSKRQETSTRTFTARLAEKSPDLKPELTRSPSKAASMFSGTQEKCSTCSKTVYPLEKVTVEGQFYHKSCFKCSHGGCSITPSNYAALDGILYCKHHFSQLFREKGSYAHIMKSASMKRGADPVPEVVAAPAPEA